MTESYINPAFYDFNKIYDFSFNSKIGFAECLRLQEDIRKHIECNTTEFDIDYCDFISDIKIILESNKDESYICESLLLDYNNGHVMLKLVNYDWIYDIYFNYNLIRYSLYVIYYKYLKETNPQHKFVNFVNFLAKINFDSVDLMNKYTSINDYIELLRIEHSKPINEQLFINAFNAYLNLRSQQIKFQYFVE